MRKEGFRVTGWLNKEVIEMEKSGGRAGWKNKGREEIELLFGNI